MATQMDSPERAVAEMASLLRAKQLDCARYTALFNIAARSDRLSACKQYVDGIEVMIRQRQRPEAEILGAYGVLTGRVAASLIDMLTTVDNKTRVARVLRRQACRVLVQDSVAEIPIASLEDIALGGDAGRLTAIDFLVTRLRPRPEHARLVVQLMGEITNKKVLIENRRRCDYTLRVLKLTNTLDELGPHLPAAIAPQHSAKGKDDIPPIESIISATDVKKNVQRLQSLSPAELSRWLQILRRASEGTDGKHSDKSRYAVSNVLGNLARSFQTDPVVSEILALAIDLEDMASEPSEYVFDKLQRVCVAALKYGGPAFATVARGLELCAKRVNLHSGKSTPAGVDERLTGAMGLLKKLASWEPLVDAVVRLHDDQYGPVIARILLLSTRTENFPYSNCDAGRRSDIDRLMTLALQSLPRNAPDRMRLHEIYMLNYASCFDEQEIDSYANGPELEPRARLSALAMWAYIAPCASEAYRRCSQLVSLFPDTEAYKLKRVEIFEHVLSKHAFLGFAERLDIPLLLHDDGFVQSEELTAVLSAARYHLPPLQGIFAAHHAFRILRNAGDHFDAYCALQAMVIRARELCGNSGVRFRAYRRALRIYMADELELPQGLIQSSLVEKFGNDSDLSDGLDATVDSVVAAVLSRPNSEVIREFEKIYEKLQSLTMNDPVLSFGADSVIADPPLAIYNGRRQPLREPKTIQTSISRLVHLTHKLDGSNWLDRLWVSERLLPLSSLAGSMQLPDHIIKNIDARAAEKMQGDPVQAMRQHLCSPHQRPLSTKQEALEVPADVVCVSLSFDAANTLIVTRRENGCQAVTVRLPGFRSSLLEFQERPLTYIDAVSTINDIVNAAGSVQVSEDTSGERERFWKLQYELDDRMQSLLVSIQRSWISGFATMFGPKAKWLEIDDDVLTGLSTAISQHIPTVSAQHLVISAALGACIRDVVLADGSGELLLHLLQTLFETLLFQGAPIPVDEMDIQRLVADVRREVQSRLPPSASATERKHIVLVCDRKASVIPWEMLPVLQGCSVTRAVSLNQLAEWESQRRGDTAGPEKVTVILNPQGNLPRTQEKFDTEFRLRGWQGYIGTAPTRDQFVDAFKNSSSLVYVGHGSGSMLAEPTVIRRLFLTETEVYLFGCSSAAIQHPFFNKDAVTSYVVAGSRTIMGTLWNVKDKDCNRFTSEFLSRVFDDREHAGKALWEARKACMLPYLTSAAWVLYGLPSAAGFRD